MTCSNNNFNPKSLGNENFEELSVLGFFNFLLIHWKTLFLASIVGALLGLCGWFFLGKYTTQYYLLNNNKINPNSGSNYGLNLISLRYIQRGLPNLALQKIDENKVPTGQENFYQHYANEKWWLENITPVYSLSKIDIKDLTPSGSDSLRDNNQIASFLIKVSDSSEKKCLAFAKSVESFIRSGGSYLQLRALLTGYELDSKAEVADLQRRLARAQNELSYQLARMNNLESSYKRFNFSTIKNPQVNNDDIIAQPYSWIRKSLVDTANEINASKESIARIKDRLSQLGTTRNFLDEALPLSQNIYDGLLLANELVKVQEKIKLKVGENDFNQAAGLNTIYSEILEIETRFKEGLDSNVHLVIIKIGMYRSISIGLVVVLMGTLMILLISNLNLSLVVKIKEFISRPFSNGGINH